MVDWGSEWDSQDIVAGIQRTEIANRLGGAKGPTHPCGGIITKISFSEKFFKKHGLRGEKAVVLSCKFCDTDSVIADKKCLWCGEDNSWQLNRDEELSCPSCNQYFTAATCKHCKKESPAMRLYLVYSPERILKLQAEDAEATKDLKGCFAFIGFIIFIFVAAMAIALLMA